jgi:hypothetical protein
MGSILMAVAEIWHCVLAVVGSVGGFQWGSWVALKSFSFCSCIKRIQKGDPFSDCQSLHYSFNAFSKPPPPNYDWIASHLNVTYDNTRWAPHLTTRECGFSHRKNCGSWHMYEVKLCGSIHYNVQYAVFIVACITLNDNLTLGKP